MKKRLIALSLAVALAALLIVPVAISKGHAKGKNKFQLNGVVVSNTAATDTAPGAIVVKVKSGTCTVKKLRGQERTFVVSPTAKMKDATIDPAVPATLESFVEGAKVHLGGTIDRGATPGDPATWVLTATKLILQKLPAPVQVVTP
jgi:hypothetical protein